MKEHPITQEIYAISVFNHGGGGEGYTVGYEGVTRIEATTKSGLHADIPYIRIWKGDLASAEFCQHNIVAVYFKEEKQ